MNKWVKSFLLSAGIILGIYTIMLFSVKGIGELYRKTSHEYSNNISTSIPKEKILGMELIDEALSLGDNYFIFGSSELGGASKDKFHPSNVFKGKKGGFQVNIVGRGNCQSLYHTINILSHKEKLEGEKFAFIVSPQWFSNEGIRKERFVENFSPLQYLTVILDKDIEEGIKEELSSRVYSLTSEDKKLDYINLVSLTYSRGTIDKKAGRMVLKPLNYLYKEILSVGDLYHSKNIKETYHKIPVPKAEEENINWQWLMEWAEVIGEENAVRKFNVDREYYEKHLKPKLEELKDYQKDLKLTESQEYEDFDNLLKTLKGLKCDVLFINVPVNGYWYDYAGVDRNEREECYKKISKEIGKYGFKEINLTEFEYRKYILKDIMHLGWKGWVYVDKAIYEHFN